MKKKYTVGAAFWHRGRLVAAGETLTLSKAEAKYLGHVLTEVVAEAPAAPAAAPAEAPAVEAPIAGVSVAEKAHAPHAKRKRQEAGHDDSAN